MLNRLQNIFPYYINHVIVGAFIGLATLFLTGGLFGPIVGAAFYGAREVIQWRSGLRWDGRGFHYPVWALTIAEAALQIAKFL